MRGSRPGPSEAGGSQQKSSCVDLDLLLYFHAAFPSTVAEPLAKAGCKWQFGLCAAENQWEGPSCHERSQRDEATTVLAAEVTHRRDAKEKRGRHGASRGSHPQEVAVPTGSSAWQHKRPGTFQGNISELKMRGSPGNTLTGGASKGPVSSNQAAGVSVIIITSTVKISVLPTDSKCSLLKNHTKNKCKASLCKANRFGGYYLKTCRGCILR